MSTRHVLGCGLGSGIGFFFRSPAPPITKQKSFRFPRCLGKASTWLAGRKSPMTRYHSSALASEADEWLHFPQKWIENRVMGHFSVGPPPARGYKLPEVPFIGMHKVCHPQIPPPSDGYTSGCPRPLGVLPANFRCWSPVTTTVWSFTGSCCIFHSGGEPVVILKPTSLCYAQSGTCCLFDPEQSVAKYSSHQDVTQ